MGETWPTILREPSGTGRAGPPSLLAGPAGSALAVLAGLVLPVGGDEADAVALVAEGRPVVLPAAVPALLRGGRQRASVLGATGHGPAVVAAVRDAIVVVVRVAG